MKGGLLVGLVAGTLLGLSVGFVAFSGGPGPGAEALDLPAADAATTVAGRGSADEREAPLAPAADRAVSTAREERAAELVPDVRAAAATGDGVIEGVVTDVDGAPLAGVLIRAAKTSDRTLSEPKDDHGAPDEKSLEETIEEAAREWHERQGAIVDARTDEAGRYRLAGLVDAKYRLTAHAKGYEIESRSGGSYSIRPGRTVNFKAMRVHEILLTVTLPGGSPIARVGVEKLTTSDGSRRQERFLWTRGSRTLRVPPGSYELRAFVDAPLSRELGIPEMTSDERTVDVHAGAATEPVALELRPQRGIRGHVVVPDDVPFAQSRAVLLPAPASGEMDLATFQNSEKTTWIHGSRPDFEFLDLKPGRYAVGIARGWNTPAITYGVVDVVDGVAPLTIEMPVEDDSSHLVVRLRNHAGDSVKAQMFTYRVKTGRSSHSSQLEHRVKGTGEYWLDLDERMKEVVETGAGSAGTKVWLSIHTRKLGTKQVELPPGQRELEVVFSEPATLDVTVAGFVGSGYEGRLYVKLAAGSGDSDVYSFSNNDVGLAADGTQSLGPVEVGSYDVQLWVRDRKGGYWSDRVLQSTPVRLVAGANAATIAMPALYRLTVRFDDSGGHLQLTGGPKKGIHISREVTGSSIDFTMLPAGRYDLQRWNSKADGTMSVQVPDQTDVRFAVSAKNGLKVYFQGADSWLAQAGFRSNDVVIAFAGKEFASETEMRALWAKGVKQAWRGVTVLRGAERVTLDVDLQDLMVKGEEGGRFWPVSR